MNTSSLNSVKNETKTTAPSPPPAPAPKINHGERKVCACKVLLFRRPPEKYVVAGLLLTRCVCSRRLHRRIKAFPRTRACTGCGVEAPAFGERNVLATSHWAVAGREHREAWKEALPARRWPGTCVRVQGSGTRRAGDGPHGRRGPHTELSGAAQHGGGKVAGTRIQRHTAPFPLHVPGRQEGFHASE